MPSAAVTTPPVLIEKPAVGFSIVQPNSAPWLDDTEVLVSLEAGRLSSSTPRLRMSSHWGTRNTKSICQLNTALSATPELLLTRTWIEYPAGATPAATVISPLASIEKPAGAATSCHPVRGPLLVDTHRAASRVTGSTSSPVV